MPAYRLVAGGIRQRHVSAQAPGSQLFGEKKMLLEELAFTEVEAYLNSMDIILVPVGSVEQHSPYGLIGTDFMVAEALARKVGEMLEVLVAPTLCYGVSTHHMAFRGTVSLSPATFIAVVDDIVESLTAHGFRRIVFINGHGGNTEPLKTAFQQVKGRDLAGCLEVISWYAEPAVKTHCRKAFGDNEGHHATPSEVAVTRFLRPKVFGGKAANEVAVEHPRYCWPLTAKEMRRLFPDGRMESAPWLATEALGEQIYDIAVAILRQKVEDIIKLPLRD
jgi:creatinine amidohydrolase